jgi:hypothetical protein
VSASGAGVRHRDRTGLPSPACAPAQRPTGCVRRIQVAGSRATSRRSVPGVPRAADEDRGDAFDRLARSSTKGPDAAALFDRVPSGSTSRERDATRRSELKWSGSADGTCCGLDAIHDRCAQRRNDVICRDAARQTINASKCRTSKLSERLVHRGAPDAKSLSDACRVGARRSGRPWKLDVDAS